VTRRWLLLCLSAHVFVTIASAQSPFDLPTLTPDHFRSGEATLRALAPVSAATRYSIVKLNVNGETVALGTVMDTNGLALTKASEIKPGKLTCWLASDKEVDAELLAIDEEEDVALVQVHQTGLKPIAWSVAPVAVGQWAITPGIAHTPHALGIISALPRHIRPRRALIGVEWDSGGSLPRIGRLVPGLSAEKGGLKPGDIILAVNSTPVTNRNEVVEMLRELRKGQMVKLRIRREESQFDAELQMMAPNSEVLAAEFDPDDGLTRMTGTVSVRAQGFEQAIEHDTVLLPWLCGGPLVDLDGKAIGLNIARASRVSSYALPSRLVQKILENLKAAPRLHSR
jgi:serine protease Do